MLHLIILALPYGDHMVKALYQEKSLQVEDQKKKMADFILNQKPKDLTEYVEK